MLELLDVHNYYDLLVYTAYIIIIWLWKFTLKKKLHLENALTEVYTLLMYTVYS